MKNKLLTLIPGMDHEELIFLERLTAEIPPEDVDLFASFYNNRRKTYDTILIATVVGFFGIAGIQRFIMGQIGMGVLFLLTCGLCFIGTIVDLVNYKSLTQEYNQKMAQDALYMTKVVSGNKQG